MRSISAAFILQQEERLVERRRKMEAAATQFPGGSLAAVAAGRVSIAETKVRISTLQAETSMCSANGQGSVRTARALFVWGKLLGAELGDGHMVDGLGSALGGGGEYQMPLTDNVGLLAQGIVANASARGPAEGHLLGVLAAIGPTFRLPSNRVPLSFFPFVGTLAVSSGGSGRYQTVEGGHFAVGVGLGADFPAFESWRLHTSIRFVDSSWSAGHRARFFIVGVAP